MVSGVGPSESLRALNIPVVADRPGVGQNMQGHVYFGISYRVNAPTISSLQIPSFTAEQAALYRQHPAAGMYTNPVIDALAWEKLPKELRTSWDNDTVSRLAVYPEDWPEVEYIALSKYLGRMEDSREADPNEGFNYGSLAVALCTPQSRGTVTLASADTNDLAVINPNWLSQQADVDVTVAGFKRARDFFATNAMQSFVVDGEAYPGSNVTTDAQIKDVFRRSFNTVYHAACACSMGREGDPNAVVDTRGRVIGVSGLRVVDASAFPVLPPGHPQATVCKFQRFVCLCLSFAVPGLPASPG
jgi:choline dehydrogenase